MRSVLCICILFLFLENNTARGQVFSPNNYPQNYFQWPVGAAIGIAANFGELRPNHYHMGLDCRTDQKENVPVYAAADGYIAKIKIEPFGFGRCIYINHPNGLTTLYAHLNAFEPALEKYVTTQQYNLEQWSIFIEIPPTLFPVKKGDYIAASGNTGGSQGPHTHFEIRETATDKNLNPLLFGFPLADDIAPYVTRLAVYDRTKSTYDQSPKIYPLKKVNGVYVPANGKIIAPSGKVSFAITSYDRYTGSSNQNGIYAAAVFADDERISSFELNNISYDETRYLNAHIDYRVRNSGGGWLQHLSPLPGYYKSVYKTDKNAGVIYLADSVQAIKIIVADANENQTEISFMLLPPAESVEKRNASTGHRFAAGFINVLDEANCYFFLPENALYDTINLVYKEIATGAGKVHQIHNASIPVHTYFTVNIRDEFAGADTSKIIMKRSYGGKEDYKKAVCSNGFCSAAFREFGNFQLLVDNIAPNVVPVGFRDGMNAQKLNRILLTVTDNAEDLKSFTALLDGKWLRFSNDKGRNFIYYFDDRCPPGEHELKITAIDLAGNKTEKLFHFTR